MWDHCGMARSEKGLKEALARIPALREEFWRNLWSGRYRRRAEPVAREGESHFGLPRIGRAYVCRRSRPSRIVRRAFARRSQTEDGEALRDDARFAYVAAWEWQGRGQRPVLHQEPLKCETRAPSAKELQVTMKLTLNIWRQRDGQHSRRSLVTYQVSENHAPICLSWRCWMHLTRICLGKGEAPVRIRT